MSLEVIIYTDGGAKPNPGPGGWGALVIYPEREQALSGNAPDTTNNQMELTAVCEALDSLPAGCRVTLYTDSTYVRNGITSWIKTWRKNGWVNSKREPVANRELWQRLDEASQRHRITWKWVRGHAGNTYNERVDQLATAARLRLTGAPADDPPAPAIPPAPASHAAYLMTLTGEARDGAWGALVRSPDGEREQSGALNGVASENHAILVAAVALGETLDPHSGWAIHTPSEYLQKGASSWVRGWVKNGWKTAKGQPVMYRDLWERLHALTVSKRLRWVYVPANQPPMQAALHIARQMTTGRRIDRP